MKTKTLRSLAALAFAAATACNKDANTVTGPNPTPTPLVPADVKGSWSGTFTFTDDPGDCGSGPVTATFGQTQSHITGSLATGGGCRFSVDIAADVTGDQIQGTATMADQQSGTVFGHAGSGRLSLQLGKLYYPNSTTFSPGGSAQLTRVPPED
jgi:hypothetical protein